jgi:hypothetical protein
MLRYPLAQMLNLGVVPAVTFPPDSRYHGFSLQQYTGPDRQTIPYLARRIVPQPGAPNYATINQYTVQQNDRLDLIAAKFLGDPLMAWLLCDANGAMSPDELVATPGDTISITTPQGVPGGQIAR